MALGVIETAFRPGSDGGQGFHQTPGACVHNGSVMGRTMRLASRSRWSGALCGACLALFLGSGVARANAFDINVILGGGLTPSQEAIFGEAMAPSTEPPMPPPMPIPPINT